MKKIKNILLNLLLVGCVFNMGCSKYKVQYEGAYDDSKSVDPTTQPKGSEIIYVESGKLYAIDRTLTNVKTYPNIAASGSIAYASINPAHTKIAYKTISGNINIIDSTGTFIATIPSTTAVNSFDWHANNETLYYVDGFTLKFYGKALTTSITDFNTTAIFPVGGTFKKVFGASVLADGSVVYLTEYYTGSNYVRTFTVDKLTGKDVKQQIYTFNVPLTWMRLAPTDLILYYGGSSGSIAQTYQAGLTSTSDVDELLYPLKFAVYSQGYGLSASIQYDKIFISNSTSSISKVIGSNVTALDW